MRLQGGPDCARSSPSLIPTTKSAPETAASTVELNGLPKRHAIHAGENTRMATARAARRLEGRRPKASPIAAASTARCQAAARAMLSRAACAAPARISAGEGIGACAGYRALTAGAILRKMSSRRFSRHAPSSCPSIFGRSSP